ncbi:MULTISPECIES: hypothetical protein [Isoptericola]|uniref:Uncharacterized protein n=1 Tax=Isoptericola sediminis TaxID=2733572 RepID=A0A849K874_9MICO|nr:MULTISPECIES: hypothetical protein [Isoptericola]MDO8148468.1 hypothetical protein [Isoptericola sp. b515]NNU28239.1 hypothetical protein [Isoptericola sediminis]
MSVTFVFWARPRAFGLLLMSTTTLRPATDTPRPSRSRCGRATHEAFLWTP